MDKICRDWPGGLPRKKSKWVLSSRVGILRLAMSSCWIVPLPVTRVPKGLAQVRPNNDQICDKTCARTTLQGLFKGKSSTRWGDRRRPSTVRTPPTLRTSRRGLQEGSCKKRSFEWAQYPQLNGAATGSGGVWSSQKSFASPLCHGQMRAFR